MTCFSFPGFFELFLPPTFVALNPFHPVKPADIRIEPYCGSEFIYSWIFLPNFTLLKIIAKPGFALAAWLGFAGRDAALQYPASPSLGTKIKSCFFSGHEDLLLWYNIFHKKIANVSDFIVCNSLPANFISP